MEEKLLELFKIAVDYGENSKENYMEVDFDYKKIEINIRKKETYEYFLNLVFFIEDIDLDKMIRKIKTFIEEE